MFTITVNKWIIYSFDTVDGMNFMKRMKSDGSGRRTNADQMTDPDS